MPLIGLDDLPFVMEAMGSLKARWKNIGIMVGLQQSVLGTIEATYRSNIVSCYIDMIAEWLSNP